MPHAFDCKSGNQGPEWSGAALNNDSGWTCDECNQFISVSVETEARMVMAHKQGRKKARLGFQREYIINLAKILPTVDEQDAFVAGFDGEKRRMALQ